MEGVEHIVEFDKYCNKCKHKTEDENDVDCPCYDCLVITVNTYSHKPINFKERENKQ